MRKAARFVFPLVLALPCLADPGTASGVVTDEKTGNPVVGAKVEVARHVQGQGKGPDIRETKTDEAGSYRAEGLIADRYSIRVTAGDRQRTVTGVDLEEGGSLQIDVALNERDEAPHWWYSIGGKVSHASDVDEASTESLSFNGFPRWWPALDLILMPRTLEELPEENWSATLRLDVNPSPTDPEVLVVEITVKTGEQGLYRWAMHRNTNIVPFLFAFRADGKAVRSHRRSVGEGGSSFGGMPSTLTLVESNSERRWKLAVTAKSLDQRLPDPLPQKLEIVAAFSPTQHEVVFRGHERSESKRKDVKREELPLRSQVVALIRKDGAWRVPE